MKITDLHELLIMYVFTRSELHLTRVNHAAYVFHKYYCKNVTTHFLTSVFFLAAMHDRWNLQFQYIRGQRLYQNQIHQHLLDYIDTLLEIGDSTNSFTIYQELLIAQLLSSCYSMLFKQQHSSPHK